MMKERPIIFNTEMVKAILDGRKTQTRRVVKLHKSINTRSSHSVQGKVYSMGDIQRESEMNLKPNIPCPYGTIGDHLWVRETWRILDWRFESAEITYYADDYLEINRSIPKAFIEKLDFENQKWQDGNKRFMPYRKRVSIHMPRWASRITLEITDIRVGRVQEIPERETFKEGIRPADHIGVKSGKEIFAELWDSLNAKRGYSWGSNSWVWVIAFKIAGK